SITIVTQQEGLFVHLMVKDTGMGIKEEEMSRLFHSFQQFGTPMTNKFGGSGLGLAISKEIVEHHKGRIWAESEYEKGTTLHVLLPVDLVINVE
ncbi:MAG: ATP-binding protein, partial [Chlamydiota bacterium]|nr:ATP-binding protein [Chlamydiota bacterium]